MIWGEGRDSRIKCPWSSSHHWAQIEREWQQESRGGDNSVFNLQESLTWIVWSIHTSTIHGHTAPLEVVGPMGRLCGLAWQPGRLANTDMGPLWKVLCSMLKMNKLNCSVSCPKTTHTESRDEIWSQPLLHLFQDFGNYSGPSMRVNPLA